MLTRYHFEIYLSVYCSASSFRIQKDHLQPRLAALGLCFDSTVTFRINVSGVDQNDDQIDWTNTEPRPYQFYVAYTGSDESEVHIHRIRQTVDGLRKYYRLHWLHLGSIRNSYTIK